MAKKQIQSGLSGLLNPNPVQAPTPTVETSTAQPVQAHGKLKSARGTTVRVCYNLNAELVEKIKRLAEYERKNINEVYNEALEAYIKNWTPTVMEPPQL